MEKGEEFMKKKQQLTAVLCIYVILVAGCQSKSENRETCRLEGIEELNAGNYSAAVSSFEQALEKSKGRVGEFELDVLKYRGEAEYRLGDYEAASYTFDVLIQVDEARPEYLYLKCLADASSGKWESALADYEKAYAANPQVPVAQSALLALGTALEQQGNLEQALAFYQQAAADGLQNSELYNRMGLCKLEDGEYAQAMEYFQAGIQAGDQEVLPQLVRNQAVVYEKQLEFEKALEVLEGYRKNFGEDPDVEREIAFLKSR